MMTEKHQAQNSDDKVRAKRAAGAAAAQLIQPGMIVGLGTGSTAAFFIESLIERCHQGLRIQAVATSQKSRNQALQGGIPLLEMDTLSEIDLAVDGADEIDHKKRMIKGGGGALLREKIVASSSREMIVIIDESKFVEKLGTFPLPVEILPFGLQATLFKIRCLGYQGNLRKKSDQTDYLTENGNYLFDIHFSSPIDDPEHIAEEIKQIPGVIDTGFFFHLAGRVIIGDSRGQVKILS